MAKETPASMAVVVACASALPSSPLRSMLTGTLGHGMSLFYSGCWSLSLNFFSMLFAEQYLACINYPF